MNPFPPLSRTRSIFLIAPPLADSYWPDLGVEIAILPLAKDMSADAISNGVSAGTMAKEESVTESPALSVSMGRARMISQHVWGAPLAAQAVPAPRRACA